MTTTRNSDEVTAPSQAVVEAVAAREDVDPTELTPPLYAAIDPDGLDALFSAETAEREQALGQLAFDYKGYEVTVFGDGTVEVEPADATFR